jgi:hypothetical protein
MRTNHFDFPGSQETSTRSAVIDPPGRVGYIVVQLAVLMDFLHPPAVDAMRGEI